MSEPHMQFGRYMLEKKIASGGMGEIFLARHVDHDTDSPPVALKRVLEHLSGDRRFVRRFFGEAKIIAELDHENLVHVIDFGKENGAYYMVMDYIDGFGGDLLFDRAVKNPEAWPLECGVELVSQALRGMAYAHHKRDEMGRPLGIVHLDLSLHNLMLSRDGLVKVLDFGISQAAYGIEQKSIGSLTGTYAYMSPEQCREEKKLDRRSDLFTLGIVLYELTTLQPLFRKQPSEFMTLKAINDGIVPPPSNFSKKYPPELERVVYRALEIDKNKRFNTAADFFEELKEVADTYRFGTGAGILASAFEELFDESDEEECRDGEGESGEQEKKAASSTDATEAEGEREASPDGGKDFSEIAEAAEEKEIPGRAPEAERAGKPEKKAKESEKGSPRPLTVQEELELDAVHRRRSLAAIAVFIVLFAGLFGLFWFFYMAKVGPMPDRVGSTVYMPDSGKIRVYTVPGGASVSINMKKQDAVTPATFKSLPLDRKLSVRVDLPGYKTVEKTLTLTMDSPLDAVLVEFERE